MIPNSTVSTLLYIAGLWLAASDKAAAAFSLGISRQGSSLTGPAGHVAALKRYGRPVPSELESAAKDPSILIDKYKSQISAAELNELTKQTGSAPTSGNWSYGWQVPVIIGESKLNLYVDTGSSDLWVLSDLLPKNESQGYDVYNTSTGTLLKGYYFDATYRGDGGASGLVYQDTVQIGGVTATSQAIEVATALPAGDSFSPADGVLGLGPDTLNTIKPKRQPTLWQTLNPMLEEPVFAADFNETGGSLEFGYINSKYQTSVTYVPIVRDSVQYYWISFTEFDINGTTYVPRLYNHSISIGFIDSGSTGLYVSNRAADLYYSKVRGAQFIFPSWVIPCLAELPDFGINLGGKYFYAPGRYIKQPLGDDTGVCYGVVQGFVGPYDTYDYGAIFGSPLFLGNYIVFDKENDRIGFLPKF